MIINLSNLATATQQQVFDQVAKHLLDQNKISIKEGHGYCAYRGTNNLKCAAGCLIADNEYDLEMDSFVGDTSWEGLINRGLVKTDEHKLLIGELQHIHDTIDRKFWYETLKDFAKTYNLSFNHIESETV